MRTILLVVLGLHGVIHCMGFAKAFGLAELEQLTQPISRPMGVVWLVAGAAMLGSAVHLLVAPRTWWITGGLAVVLSQVVIVSAWQDARIGTVANAVVLAAVVYGFLSQGPFSFRTRYEEGAAALAATVAAVVEGGSPPADLLTEDDSLSGDDFVTQADLLTEDDIAHLPAPVRRYVVRSGFVGQPRVRGFRVVGHGRIRAGPDEPWMAFTSEQRNTVEPPSRFFHMKARKSGLPVDVLHVFRDGHATMRGKLLSLIPVVDGQGPEMDRAETVTLFNDIALMAPGALAHPGIRWEEVDDRTARGHFTAWDETVSATLIFNDRDELVDFVSEDRFASPDGKTFIRRPWSTPVSDYQDLGPYHVMRHGEGRWHPSDAEPYTYLELELVELDVLHTALNRSETLAPLPDSARPSGL